MHTGNRTTLLCILFGFPQHLILQHMPVNMILEFLHLFQFSLWQQGLEHLQNINHYRIELSTFSREKTKQNKLSKIRMWEISEITTLHNFVHLIKLTSNICALSYDGFKFIYGQRSGSSISELKLKV